MSSGPRQQRKPNRLISSTSPYLLQHAHNPVDWFPWGEEAFAAARARNCPIFLSIGYSTCYWCHVMERESFEDEATARLMNERLVCIKLDREERPDLDEVYMAATVAMTGQGGWPMSVFLEPDTLRPFFCGTYYPREPMHGRPTFKRVVEGIAGAFANQREDVRAQAARLGEAVAEHVGGAPARAALGAGTVETALTSILNMFDGVHGGFGMAPKFPQVVFLEFLLDAREIAEGETRAAIDACVRKTLDAMAMGGIHDHLGGGFHRYSVDAQWTVPHFEKMLYDQAQMLSVYGRAATVYEDAWYAKVAERVEWYVASKLTQRGSGKSDGDGGWGFSSAQDAEVDAREGLTYLWTPEQVRAARPKDEAELAAAVFGLDKAANFQDPHHPADEPAWVLRMDARPEVVAARLGMRFEEFEDRLSHCTSHLLAERAGRKQPATDDKVLACWNGMMIAALARQEDEHSRAEAAQVLLAVLGRLNDGNGGLLRTVRRGSMAHTPAFLEDYAAMIAACCAVARVAAPEERGQWRERAAKLMEKVRGTFFSEDGAMVFDARASKDLFVRACSTHDGAVQSGYAMLLHAMIDLAALAPDASSRRGLVDEAVRTMAIMSGRIAASPAGCVESVRALLRLVKDYPEAAARLAEAPSPGAAAPDAVDSASAVEVFAGVDRVTLAPDVPAELMLLLRVKPGYHVTGADADSESLSPLRVGVFGGTGVAVYADYPAGNVSGELELRVALERSGEWSGTSLLYVSFQACTQTECLRPARVELDISLDRA